MSAPRTIVLSGLILLMLPVPGKASYSHPNGVWVNAGLIQNTLRPGTVDSSEIHAVVEERGKPSWEWQEWKTRSSRSIALHECTRLVLAAAGLFFVAALLIRRWRFGLASAGVVILLACYWFTPLLLHCIPPYRSFDYLDEFIAVPDASYPGDGESILLYEKPTLRPHYRKKAVIFCNGMARQLSVDEIRAALDAQGIAFTEHGSPANSPALRSGE